MPRAGESPLAQFTHAIASEDGFSFGMPRLTEDGSAVVLPIVRDRPEMRRFELAAEVADEISAIDVGRLDRLRVRNDSESRVFLPPGSLFAGRGTASRGTTMGVLIDPGSSRDLEVKCVHPSQAIRGGAPLQLTSSLAPYPIARALLSGDQEWVWSVVSTFAAAARLAASRDRSAAPGVSDDLVAMLSSPVARQLAPAPRPEQYSPAQLACGVVLLDAGGVVAFEFLDHPAARRVPWRAMSCDRLPLSGPRVALDPESSLAVARQFLKGLTRRPSPPAGAGDWRAPDDSATCTVDDGQVVYLLAFGPRLALRGPVGLPGSSFGRGDVAAVEDPWIAPAVPADGSVVSEGGDTAVVAAARVGVSDDTPPLEAEPRLRRRKVLTSGWDATTFESLERFSRKEFRGDRSAAIRALVRGGLRLRGYTGPRFRAPAPGGVEPDGPSVDTDEVRGAVVTRIRDLERIAETGSYAAWLRKRARLELERMAAGPPEGRVRAAAQSALDRLSPDLPEEVVQPEEVAASAPPPVPPVFAVRPLLRRAFASSAAGRYADALSLFDDVLTAEPDNRTALLGRAVALRRSGKLQEALESLDRVLRTEPGNAAALLHRGRLLMERGDLAGALEAFDRLAAVAPNDWDVWMARGDLFARMDREPDALQAYREALRRNPEDESLRLRIHELELAKAAPPPAAQRIQLPHEVQQGQTYLVRERRPDLSLHILQALVTRSVPSLVLTNRPTEALRADFRLPGVRVVEFSHAPGEGHQSPTALGALTSLLERFVRQNGGRGVILLDGLASLVLENGFRETVLFIERVHEAVLQSEAVFLLSLAPGDLTEREEALLERNLRTLA